jgi:hypothetical protein
VTTSTSATAFARIGTKLINLFIDALPGMSRRSSKRRPCSTLLVPTFRACTYQTRNWKKRQFVEFLERLGFVHLALCSPPRSLEDTQILDTIGLA